MNPNIPESHEEDREKFLTGPGMKSRKATDRIRQLLCALLHWLRYREDHRSSYHQTAHGTEWYCPKCEARKGPQIPNV